MRNRPAITLALALLALTQLAAAQGDEPATFAFSEAQQAHRFHKDFVRFLTYDQGKIPLRDGVLLVGSSSMGGWHDHARDLAPLQTAKRGFGGSTMEDVLLFQNFFLRYEAGTVVIYEGDNDIWKGTAPETFVAQCKQFCEALFETREDTQIYFIAIKPSIKRWEKWPTYVEANKRLAAYCDTDERLHMIDVVTPMLGEDGKPRPHIFKADNLHMNRAGYDIWRDAVRKALGADPVAAP